MGEKQDGVLPAREESRRKEKRKKGRRTERERMGKERGWNWEIREMGLYLLEWECNTDTYTFSLRLLACLQTGHSLK